MNYQNILEYEKTCKDSKVLEIIKLLKQQWIDADRFRFIACHKTTMNPQMNGNHYYHLRSGGWPELRGSSFEEAVDKAMEQVKQELMR